MTMSDNERMILIRYYAKMIIEHNLLTEELHKIIERIAELSRLSGEKN